MDLLDHGRGFLTYIYPDKGQDHCVKDYYKHDKRVEISVLDYSDAGLADGGVGVYLGFGGYFVALQLELNVFFLKASQSVISINSSLLSVKCVYDHLNEQVSDEQRTKDHVDYKHILVDWVLSPLWLKPYFSRVHCIDHEIDPALSGAHGEQGCESTWDIVEVSTLVSPKASVIHAVILGIYFFHIYKRFQALRELAVVKFSFQYVEEENTKQKEEK